jgi:hypothetical protein
LSTPRPGSPRLRAALSWWRAAAALATPPVEADFVSGAPQDYARLLGDAFIIDATSQGDFVFRYVGTELADYIGRAVSLQKLDLRPGRRDSDLIRDVLSRTDATMSPQLALGRIMAGSSLASGPIEVICLPLRTTNCGAAFFGAAAREGLDKLPPTASVRRIEISSVVSV